MGSPVTRSIWLSRLIRARTSTACTVEAEMPSSPAICAGPSLRRHRNRRIRFTVAGGVLVGIERGRLDRSTIPAGPSARNRAAHFRAVGGEVMNIFAATMTGQRSSTMSLASRSRARGVRAALAWDKKASCVREAVPRQLHSRNGRPSPVTRSHAIHATTSLDITLRRARAAPPA